MSNYPVPVTYVRVKDGGKLMVIMLLIIMVTIGCVSWARYWVRGSTCTPYNNSEVIPILQISKLRLRVVKQLPLSHTAQKW